jgi:hypothetical protein
MATVTRNPDQTATVTLATPERRALVRWANEAGRTPEQQLRELIEAALTARIQMYLATDGPTRQQQYEALSPAKQAEVDAILSGG